MNYFSQRFDPEKGLLMAVKDYATARLGGRPQTKEKLTAVEVALLRSFAGLMALREGQQYLVYLDAKLAALKNLPRDEPHFTGEQSLRYNVAVEAQIKLLETLRNELATAEEKLGEEKNDV